MQEIITRSPFLNCETLFPTSSITPMPSCPRILPGTQVGTSPFRMCRSVPQIVVFTILTTASLGCSSLGLGRSSTEIDLGPWYTSAFIVLLLFTLFVFILRRTLNRFIDRNSNMPGTAGILPISSKHRRPPSARVNLAGRLGSVDVFLPDYKGGWKSVFIKRSVNTRLKSKKSSRKTIRLVRSYRKVPCVGHCLGGAGLYGM
jgi:hypothetical protein